MPTLIAHEVDYKIYGGEMQFVEIELDPGEAAVAGSGSMAYMESGIQMSTILGDGSQKTSGVIGKLFGVGKRALTGEKLFMQQFTNKGQGKRRVAFSAPYPGKIIPLDLAKLGGEVICQKEAFLAAAKGVAVGIAFQRRLGAIFFGGEGFIMQKLEGNGMAFVHAGGTIIEKQLGVGEQLFVDTGCVVGYQSSVKFDIQMVKGLSNMMFGGEGLFLTTLTGPGHVWLQSMPFSRLAGVIVAQVFATQSKNKR